jgi:hypothetical protein
MKIYGHKYSLWENTEFLNLQPGGTFSYHYPLKGLSGKVMVKEWLLVEMSFSESLS